MKFKKFFAAVLAGAVALSSFSLSAFADGEETIASTKNIAAKSVSITYSLSTELQNNWEYDYSNVSLIVKTWNNAANAGDWIQWGLGGAEQAQWSPEGQFVSYTGTPITDAKLTVNLTEYSILDQLAVLYVPNENWDFSVSAIEAFSGTDGSGDAVWEWTVPADPEEPGEEENPDTTKINMPFKKDAPYTLTVVSASWGAPTFTKAAQVNVPVTIDGITTGTTTYGDVKAKTIELTGKDWAAYNLPEGITAENIAVAPYIKFGADSSIWKSAGSPWDLSTLEDVTDETVIGEIGYQININGNFGGIEDMDAEERNDKWEVVQEGATLILPLKDGGDTEEPLLSTIEIPFDNAGDITLKVVDASGWGNEGVTRAAQLNKSVTIASLSGKTYGELKGVKFVLKDYSLDGYTMPTGVTAESINPQIYIKWNHEGEKWGLWTAGNAPWTLPSNLTAADTDTILEIGYQINVNGSAENGINDLDVDAEVVLKKGGSGSNTPGTTTPGDDTPGTIPGTTTPSYTVGEVEDPTPSAPADDKNSVNFENSDVKVTAPEGAFDKPDEVTFNAAPVADETKGETFTFDLSFTDKDGNKVQPKSAVTVSIPLPAALTGKTVYVYHIEDNGTYTEISCKVENGMVVFTASSFSKYVITSQKLSANGEPVTEQPGSANEPNASTGVAGAAAVFSIAAAAAGAMIVSKKRK